MAQTIQLKRSAVPGNVPTTAQLGLGEIAINTYDGRLFFKKDPGTPSIVEVSLVGHNHDGVYEPLLGYTPVNVVGDTMLGALDFSSGMNGGWTIEGGKHFFTTNDGKGNVNLRVGHNPSELCTEAGYAFHMEFSQNLGQWQFNVSDVSLAVNDPITWVKALQVTAAGIDVVGNITVTGAVDGRDIAADGATLDSHVANLSNPHGVTAAQIGAVEVANGTAIISGTASASLHLRSTNASGVIQFMDNLVNTWRIRAHKASGVFDITRYDYNTGAYLDTPISISQLTGTVTVAGRDVGADGATLDSHVANLSNPHGVTAAQVGAVDITGGSMSGNLGIRKTGSAVLYLDSTDASGSSQINLQKSGINNWVIREATGSSDLQLRRHDATGTFLDIPFRVYFSSGAITTSSTVNGRDMVADGAKLDGIESGANLGEPPLGNPAADGYVLSSTAAGVRSWVPQPAGGGDMLSTNNLSDVASVSASRTNLGLGTAAVKNADTAYNSFGNGTVPIRHPAGYLYSNYFNMSSNNTTATPSRVAVEANSDGFLRWQTFGQFKANLGVTSGPTTVSSGLISLATSGVKTFSHGLGGVPTSYSAVFRCKVATGGFAVGDEINVHSNTAMAPYANASVVGVYWLASSYIRGNNGQYVTVSAANFDLKFYATL